MGFPEWTLLGMGLSAAGALLALILAYIGQSPQVLKRLGLSRTRLDRRVRAFTSYAIALLILAIGFFLAGVPLGPQPETNVSPNQPGEAETAISEQAEINLNDINGSSLVLETPILETTPATPETGAFAGPPTGAESSLEVTSEVTETLTSTVSASTSTPPLVISPATESAPATPSATNTSTPTYTPTPTNTPTPFLTPTPISGPTVVVDSGGNRIWLRRSPGGQNLVLVEDKEILLLLSGHSNQGGLLWQEVSTLEGVTGWILDELLEFDELQ